jgi:integrase
MPKLTSHPGVTLIKPKHDGRSNWRVRYINPNDGKQVWETIDRTAYRRAADRTDYAKRISERIHNRQRDLDLGATPMTNTPLSDAIERFYQGHPQLGERTHETYQSGTDRLLDWASDHKIETSDDLTRARLVEFRESVIAAPKHGRNGVKQGGKAKADTRRAPATINKELRAVSRALGYLIDLDLCAKLTHDDLRRALKPVKAPTERREFLRPAQLKKLLKACGRHDAATFELTREEKDRGEETGRTARYEPISPFVAFTLLTGMRLNEVLALGWSDVDLDALDHNGNKVGEIYLRGAKNKTGKSRTIGLEVSPALRRLLVVMRLKSAGRGPVFNVSKDTAVKAMRRLRKSYGAPTEFSYQALRRTCSTYLTNSSIFGNATAYLAAKQLGHSVVIAEKHYSGLVRGISPDARTLEAVLQIEEQVDDVIERTEQRRAA